MNKTSSSAWRVRLLTALLIGLALAALTGCAHGTLSGAPLAEANREYEAGQYEQAAALYVKLAQEGVDDAILHYNLGNAYYKLGDLGRAIASYRRAQRLLPRDADIAANLAVARQATLDDLGVQSGTDLAAWLERLLIDSLAPGEAAGAALGLWLSTAALAAALLLRRRSAWLRGALIGAATLTILASSALGIRLWRETLRPPAVIVVEIVQVASGPGAHYAEAFVLHGGAELTILEERSGWLRIALPGDLQGWIPASAAERL